MDRRANRPFSVGKGRGGDGGGGRCNCKTDGKNGGGGGGAAAILNELAARGNGTNKRTSPKVSSWR